MIDHLVYAAPDLDKAIEQIFDLTGVRASPGGKHVGLGTHNALLALGERCYLEIIAPDPEQPAPAAPMPFGLSTLTEAKLVTWAVSSEDLPKLVHNATSRNFNPGMMSIMSRQRPDGSMLTWRVTRLAAPAGDGLVPFAIQWIAGGHPAEAAPPGCSLVTLRGEHPNADVVRSQIQAMGEELEIATGAVPRLIASLDTPKGRIEIS